METPAVKPKKGKAKVKGKKGAASVAGSSKDSTTSKPKTQQILPNPDEVIEIERPGSSVSQHSNVELFAAEGERSSGNSAVPTEDKSKRPGTASSTDKQSLALSRTASPALLPFRTAQVTPVNGSQTSVRSREAWGGVDPKAESYVDRPQSVTSAGNVKAGSAIKIRDADEPQSGAQDGEDTRSVKTSQGSSSNLLSPPKMKGEEQAYVPYMFARDTIVRIVSDMHKMKDSHVGVINQIELNYRIIEDETQRQFNSFVLNLRNVYKDKLSVFQHVVTIHRKDTDKKKEYWDTNLTSLSKQNKKLLGDKKALLIQNKLLVDRVGEIREEVTRELIVKLDDLNVKLSAESKSHTEDLEKFELEKSALLEEIEQLKQRPAAAVIVTSDTTDGESKQMSSEPEIITKEVIVDMSEAERATLNAERLRMNEEMAGMLLQRQTLEKERADFIEDRKKLNDEKNQLQLKINEAEKGVAEWREKYDLTKVQLARFGSLRTDYDTLLAAYNAMALVAANISEADEKIVKCKSDRAALEEDKKDQQETIEKWEKEFKERTGKESTEDDQPDSIKESKVMLSETDNFIHRLDVEVDTMEKIKSGNAPLPPKPSAEGEKAVIQAEPVIKIVEVKVPDPDSLVKLEASEERNDKLQKENANLQTKINGLQTNISELKSQISDLEAKLKKSEAENAGNMKTILKLTNKLKEESNALRKAQSDLSTKEDGAKPDAIAAEDSPLVAALPSTEDHSECQEKIQQLEEQIVHLEHQLEEADAGITHEDNSDKVDALQAQVDELDEKLRKEQAEHNNTKEELEELKTKITLLEEQLQADKGSQDETISTATLALTSQLAKKEQELKDSQTRVADMEGKVMANVPVDAAAEMKKLIKKIGALTKESSASSKKAAELEGATKSLEAEKKSLQIQLDKEKATNATTQARLQTAKEEKDKELDKLAAQWDKKEKTRVAENKAKVEALNKKIKELQSQPAVAAVASRRKSDAAAGGDVKLQKQVTALTDQLQNKKSENKDLQAKIAALQEDVKKAKSEGGGNLKEQKKQEKILKELSKKLDMETKKAERDGAKVKQLETDMAALVKDRDVKESEVKKLKADMEQLGVTAAQALELGEQVTTLEASVSHLNKETARLTEAYNTERVQRKKYFNMVEDMKGKIRVYCRARPMSKDELSRGNFSVLKSPDEYSINVESTRGLKEFNFDRIFMPENTQEQVFEDTYHLVQSAVDGYNVCIFAYGQTGSGKTFTMIGGGNKSFPGIAPRAFKRIFELTEENKDKFDFKITTYMLELYNDKLLDLYAGKDGTPDDKMDIKKDKAGLVYVRGAVVMDAPTEAALNALFDEGSKNRHTASTKMNAESSRSHLVLSVVIEATNKTNGQVNRGKLSLVDLAGSERVGKTGASAETLKEANSINKSLAALGDVVSALSSDQQFIPYRNNKLTMLMQDSLGGNAKTLMFVNISPADYNSDETITSLTYASRVKLITNDAQKNQDNKEIARLKAEIAKLKLGESLEETEEVEV